MQAFETEHYIFHYGAGTAAERDIEKIAALQEGCFSHICAVLGLTPDFKIEYFLCDSPEEVGRICGDDEPCNGFADLPSRIYAVYNDAVQCVGFHEDAHLISFVRNRPICPAVTEGLAMYFDRKWWGIQNLDWTGGTFYIDSELDFMRNFGDSKSTQYSSIPVRVGYQQSLLGYNAFRWDRKIEPLKYEKVKKQFIYNTEMVSEEAVTYFFALAMAQADYRLAEENVASSDTLYSIGLQRHKIAAISRADLLTLQLDKVNAHNTLQNAQIALKRAMFSLASFLNLDKNTVIELDIPGRPTGKMIPVDDALMRAKENNPTFLEQRQNVLEAEQNVDKTKKESRFNASFNASVGFNQVADKLGDAYRHPLQQDLVSVSVSIPLIDWGVRKGKYNMARNNLNVVRIAARQEELSVEEVVIMTVNDFNIQQSLIASAEEALDLAVMAYEQTRQRFIIGKADVNSLTLSLNRQQEAQKNYISALQNYWLNYYKIRKLTLHDFESGFSLADKFDFNTGIYR